MTQSININNDPTSKVTVTSGPVFTSSFHAYFKTVCTENQKMMQNIFRIIYSCLQLFKLVSNLLQLAFKLVFSCYKIIFDFWIRKYFLAHHFHTSFLAVVIVLIFFCLYRYVRHFLSFFSLTQNRQSVRIERPDAPFRIV